MNFQNRILRSMSFNLFSHFDLRNIPWNIFYSQGISPWEHELRKKCPWSDIELSQMYLRNDGILNKLDVQLSDTTENQVRNENFIDDFPLDIIGFERYFFYKDGSFFLTRIFANKDETGIHVDIFITLDFTLNHKVHISTLAPFTLLQQFSNKKSFHYIPYFGKIPEAIVIPSPQGFFWNFFLFQKKMSKLYMLNFRFDLDKLKSSKGDVANESSSKNSTEAIKTDDAPNINNDVVQKEHEKLIEKLDEAQGEIEFLTDKLENVQVSLRNRDRNNEQKIENLSRENGNLKKKIEHLQKQLKQADKRARNQASANANDEFKKFCEEFDKENEDLRSEIDTVKQDCDETKAKLAEAESKIISLKGRLYKTQSNYSSGFLNIPNEVEKFDDEYAIAIMSALHRAIANTPTKSNSFGKRPIDCWQAIIRVNPDMEQAFQKYKEAKDALMDAMKSNDFERNHDLLTPLGLKFSTHTNNHGKITFMDEDPRYQGSCASTASETGSGPSNCANDLKNAFLYPTQI